MQNGVTPTRVLRLRLAPGLDRVAGVDVLARNLPLFDDPTLAAVADGNLYYIANSHWGRDSTTRGTSRSRRRRARRRC